MLHTHTHTQLKIKCGLDGDTEAAGFCMTIFCCVYSFDENTIDNSMKL